MTCVAPTACRRRRGMTLVELLLAMAITSIVALAATGMLSAVSYGSSQRTDLRSLLVQQELLAQRLSAAGRASRQVLAKDKQHLALWQTDANNDHTPQVAEVRWIVWSKKEGTITSTSLRFPEKWTAEQKKTLDRDYVAGKLPDAQLSGLGSYVVTETWATNVTGWELASTEATDGRAALLSYRVTFTDGHQQEQTLIGAAALRSE